MKRWDLDEGDRVLLKDGRIGKIWDIELRWEHLGCGCCVETAGWTIWLEMEDGQDEAITTDGDFDLIEEIQEVIE